MKATFEFDLSCPDDDCRFRLMNKAKNFKAALGEVYEKARAGVKYETFKSMTAEELLDMIGEVIQENDLSYEDLV